MVRGFILATLLVAACSAEDVERQSAAISEGLTLADCVGMFAADLGDECARPAEPRALLRGELASATGKVAGPGGAYGDAEADSVASDGPVHGDNHCVGAAEMSSASGPHLGALRKCLASRKDTGTPCATAEDVPCPPTVSEAECAYARAAAADACEE